MKQVTAVYLDVYTFSLNGEEDSADTFDGLYGNTRIIIIYFITFNAAFILPGYKYTGTILLNTGMDN